MPERPEDEIEALRAALARSEAVAEERLAAIARSQRLISDLNQVLTDLRGVNASLENTAFEANARMQVNGEVPGHVVALRREIENLERGAGEHAEEIERLHVLMKELDRAAAERLVGLRAASRDRDAIWMEAERRRALVLRLEEQLQRREMQIRELEEELTKLRNARSRSASF